ncbi:MAG: glycosyltransferase, partial [Vicinamibacterales bacterium]
VLLRLIGKHDRIRTAPRRSYPGAVAWLVGDGPLRSSFEAELAARDLASSVRVLGTRSDVPALLAAADVLVHPSLEEGFSNALLEGMAAGLPVVATAVGGNPEAIVDGVTGYLVPARDADARWLARWRRCSASRTSGRRWERQVAGA